MGVLALTPSGGKEYRNKFRVDTILIIYSDKVKLFKGVRPNRIGEVLPVFADYYLQKDKGCKTHKFQLRV